MAEITAYACSCGFRSMAPGPCRSHPYPCRAMGPEMVPLAISTDPADEAGLSELAAFVSARTKISPAEAMQVVSSDDAGARRMVENVVGSAAEFPKPRSWVGPRS